MIADLLLPLVTVALAELGDKTQLSVLLLASRTKHHAELIAGVMMAFLVVDGAAVLIGSSVAELLPISILKPLSGVMFIVFGVLMLRQKDESAEEHLYSRRPLLSGFTVILLTEWGDKTQIAAGLYAVDYNPVMVLVGTMIALAINTIIAVYLGRYILTKIKKDMIHRIAGVAFILIGLSFFLI